MSYRLVQSLLLLFFWCEYGGLQACYLTGRQARLPRRRKDLGWLWDFFKSSERFSVSFSEIEQNLNRNARDIRNLALGLRLEFAVVSSYNL